MPCFCVEYHRHPSMHMQHVLLPQLQAPASWWLTVNRPTALSNREHHPTRV